ncbi:MAG: cupin domain-containing protein [Deltaproteobacteria bacterium]|nr:cupin domain-containing protein [Deltaproteobacteria bacterium]
MAHEIIPPGFERNDERGLFREIINSGDWKAINWAKMRPGAILGNHYHKKTVMFFYLINGSARIRTVDINTGQRDEFELKAGQGVFFQPMESHIISFVDESEVLMLKSLPFDPADPDIVHHPV